MASASDHRAHAALQPADCLILLPQRLPAAVETSIGPAHYPAECTQSDAFLQPSLRARKGRANSNSFVAGQIDVRPETIDDYLSSEQNRRRHAAELQNRLRLRPFGRRPAAELATWLLPHAIENDRLAYLAELVMEECRQRRIAAPPPRSLERLCVELRYQARREIERRLTGALSAEQRRGLDALTERRAETGQSWLV